MPIFSELFRGAAPSTAALTTDALQTETSTYLARATGSNPRRQKTIDRLVKRLKVSGIMAQLYHAWLLNADSSGSSLRDLVAATDATIGGGAPTFAANSGWIGSTADWLDTGWNPSTAAIDVTDFSLSVYSESGAANSGSDLGLFDGTTNGITINTNTGTAVTFRANGALRTSSNFSTVNDGSGMFVVSVKGGNAALYRNGLLLETVAYSTTTAVNLSLFIGKLNGAASASGRKIGFVAVGKSLTADQAKELHNAFYSYRETTTSGDVLFFDPGVAPATVTADVIVYGATAQGVCAAIAARRLGLSVAICGGWRERHLGGMSSGGLGAIDLLDAASIGGLPRYIMTRMNVITAQGDTKHNFEPRVFERVMRELLDPARGGYDIPVYWSTGVDRVSKMGTTVTGWHTRDGRTFVCKDFVDATYELDLMARAGVTTAIGREAAGTGTEALNGYRLALTASGGGNHQFRHVASNTFYNVDPYRTAGVSASGLLPGVFPDPGLSAGQADTAVQAMNFRLAVSSDGKRRTTWSVADKPLNYDISTYEPLLRHLAALTADLRVDPTDFSSTTQDLWNLAATATNVFDANNGGGQSIDFMRSAYDYVLASYDEREAAWQRIRLYEQGWLYTINKGNSIEGDARVPAAVETDWNAYGLDRQHFTEPHPNDPAWWPYCLYVREGRRLVGDFRLDGNDMTMTDGSTPRSTSTIAVANYLVDSHATIMIADLSATPRIWNLGEVNVTAGGADQKSPIPYEAILPRRGECTNGAVAFGLSATHIAFSITRMEFPTMAVGQAAGTAAALAVKAGVAMQDIPYASLRATLLASPSLSGEVAPVLPQTN